MTVPELWLALRIGFAALVHCQALLGNGQVSTRHCIGCNLTRRHGFPKRDARLRSHELHTPTQVNLHRGRVSLHAITDALPEVVKLVRDLVPGLILAFDGARNLRLAEVLGLKQALDRFERNALGD